MTIGEVASRTGLRASAIRYYEGLGLLPRPSRRAGRRVYDTSIVERLAVIELAKTSGFALKEIRALLARTGGQAPATAWRELASAKGPEIDAQMQRLVLMKDILVKLKRCSCATLEECGRAFIEARAREPRDRRSPPRRARS
jgi:MerR family redox-sensitive transcriptional activator SoxR